MKLRECHCRGAHSLLGKRYGLTVVFKRQHFSPQDPSRLTMSGGMFIPELAVFLLHVLRSNATIASISTSSFSRRVASMPIASFSDLPDTLSQARILSPANERHSTGVCTAAARPRHEEKKKIGRYSIDMAMSDE